MYSDFAWQARHKLKEFWTVHSAFGIYALSNLVFYGSTAAGVLSGGRDSLSEFEVVLRSMIVLVLFAMGIILSQRSARADQEQGRLQQEMAAAAEVQSLLLPVASGGGTEASVDAICIPASEVGGDFYHLQSYLDGVQIALLGDVSRKGLKAAMLVSVAVGALQRESATTPEGILAGLNQALHGLVGGGFATCCCVRVEPGGGVTIASAGHPSPYCQGREIELEAGLPLGLVLDVE